ncbi:MAG TPA: helix-turn-helix domain-containing protein [archaeon]|nr:helix-turn-helix domain-containing protein [archaeon]
MPENENPFEKMEELICHKYCISVLRELLEKSEGVGFNALLKKIIPITPRVLSMRLKELEAKKLIQKNLVLGTKPHIEYRALPKAEGLKRAISELEKWGRKEL